VQDWVR